MFNKKEFIEKIDKQGYAIIENVVDDQMIKKIIPEMEKAIRQEADFFCTTDYKYYGIVQNLLAYGEPFFELLENRDYIEPMNAILDDGCIIYLYMSSSLPPHSGNFATRIHVERPRFTPGFRDSIGGLLLLNDFTEENGGTLILPGSHKWEEKPTEKYFYQNAERLVAKAGTVFFFDLRLWHTAGVNNTDQWRHLIGLMMVRPYLKQKFDFPKALKDKDLSKYSDFVKQKLGFFSQPPINNEEFYAPIEQRPYRQKSEWEKAGYNLDEVTVSADLLN